MKARELAKLLMQNPEMDVGIAPFGGNNHWPVTRVVKRKRDDQCDSTCLSEEFLEIMSLKGDIDKL